MQDLHAQGFSLVKNVVSADELDLLRNESSFLFSNLDAGGMRHICSRSQLIERLVKKISQDECLLPVPNMQMVRSIYFNKTADKNWPVAWHQDLSIAVKEKKSVEGYEAWSLKGNGVNHVRPPVELLQQMWTVRIHLDDTSVNNGALHVAAKSHQAGIIPSQEFVKYTEHPEICECQAGDALVMSPLILHSSHKATQPSNRRVLHFEFAPAKALNPELEWYESV